MRPYVLAILSSFSDKHLREISFNEAEEEKQANKTLQENAEKASKPYARELLDSDRDWTYSVFFVYFL